jgi:hypothetical protein
LAPFPACDCARRFPSTLLCGADKARGGSGFGLCYLRRFCSFLASHLPQLKRCGGCLNRDIAKGRHNVFADAMRNLFRSTTGVRCDRRACTACTICTRNGAGCSEFGDLSRPSRLLFDGIHRLPRTLLYDWHSLPPFSVTLHDVSQA